MTHRRPLRVCMVHYSDFHLDSRIQRQARALAERGDEIHLVCLSPTGTERFGDGVVRLHNVPVAKSFGGQSAYLSGYARFLAGAARRVTALALRERFDLVEIHNMPDALTFAALVPKLQGTPVVLNCHDTFPELFATKFGCGHGHPAVRLVHAEERISAALADHVICVTEEARRCLEARGTGRGRSSVVMNSPDPRVFGPPRPPRAPTSTGTLRILYHGGLAPRFGVETLIRAVALAGGDTPRVTLRVCGSGEDRDRLAALGRELAGDRIDVASAPVPFADIPAELQAADVGVVPTLEDRFTRLLLPVKLLEYVHMGLPAVASRLPGIERYFGEREVWFAEPGDPSSIAAAVARLCADPEEARARALRASERLREIEWTSQRAHYLALVDELASWTGAAVRKSRAPVAVTSGAAR